MTLLNICDTIDAVMLVESINFMYVYMFKHMSSSGCMYKCMYVRNYVCVVAS